MAISRVCIEKEISLEDEKRIKKNLRKVRNAITDLGEKG